MERQTEGKDSRDMPVDSPQDSRKSPGDPMLEDLSESMKRLSGDQKRRKEIRKRLF